MTKKKFFKLIKSPRLFFVDYYKKINSRVYLKSLTIEGEKVVFVFNVSPWKRDFLKKIFPEQNLIFVPTSFNIRNYHKFLSISKNYEFLVWGASLPEGVEYYIQNFGVKVRYLEDGFVRSAGLGAFHILPHSICLDQRGIYYNARTPSDLEVLLETKDFSTDAPLMKEAKECLNLILERKITKYNLPITNLAESLYGKKNRPRILVIGQVEDDQSILFGCDSKINNNEVVRLAAKENKGAQIIYKVHPDVIAEKRKEKSSPEEVEDLALLIREPMSLDDALTGVDKVYTISSLAGFESLLRGIPVVTLGSPFYAGWGLTDSRQINARRTKKLNLEELFAGAYILYPKYFNPENGEASSLRETINRIFLTMQQSRPI